MKQSRTRIARVVADRSLKAGSTKQLSRDVAAYLLSERRVGELDSILRDVQLDWAKAGRVEVLARSAHPLDATAKAAITKQIKQLYPAAGQIIVTEVHDPAVLGGVRLDLADLQLDMTAEAKLNKFKQLTASGSMKGSKV